MKKALITGITGQDGSYLAEFLLGKGYEVHGLVRRSSILSRPRIDHLYGMFDDTGKIHLHYGDLTDFSSLIKVIREVQPDELYNLAAQSHVAVSFDTPLYTGQVDALGPLAVFEAVRIVNPRIKVYQASTSELFSGAPSQVPQNEKTPMKPRSPYGVAKLYAYEMARVYREAYHLDISNGILFNHESPRRGENFVTRKITLSIADILKGKRAGVKLGNLDAKRDWGYAPDYVEAMWMMLQRDNADDYVIATGECHTVREFAELAFRLAKLDYRDYVQVDERFVRSNEVWELRGDSSKARHVLGWRPEVSFEEMVAIMVEADTGLKLT